MRLVSVASSAANLAASASADLSLCSLATIIRCSARNRSTSRSCDKRLLSLSTEISFARFSASRLRLRMATLADCSISFRVFLLSSISEMSFVRPSASNVFDGLKYSRPVWSNSVIATDSSSRPFSAKASSAAALTRVT